MQEYITCSGTVSIDKNTLYIRRKGRSFLKRFLSDILLPVFFVSVFVISLFEEPSPRRNVHVLFYGFLALTSLVPFVFDLVQRSFSNQIVLSDIIAYQLEADDKGKEVRLILQLTSGKERIIHFRKTENEAELFVAALEAKQIGMDPA